jgi:hypothetical protein
VARGKLAISIRKEDLSHLLRRNRASAARRDWLSPAQGESGSGCERLRVLDVVPFEEDESRSVLLVHTTA